MSFDFSLHDQYFVEKGNETRYSTLTWYVSFHNMTLEELMADLQRSEYLVSTDHSSEKGILYRIIGMCRVKLVYEKSPAFQDSQLDCAREYFHKSETPEANFYLGGIEYDKFCHVNGASRAADITQKNVEMVMKHRGRIDGLEILDRAVAFFTTCIDVDPTDPDGFGNIARHTIYLATQIKRWCGIAMSPKESQFGLECLYKAAEVSVRSQEELIRRHLEGDGCEKDVRRALGYLHLILSPSRNEKVRDMVPNLIRMLNEGEISEVEVEKITAKILRTD